VGWHVELVAQRLLGAGTLALQLGHLGFDQQGQAFQLVVGQAGHGLRIGQGHALLDVHQRDDVFAGIGRVGLAHQRGFAQALLFIRLAVRVQGPGQLAVQRAQAGVGIALQGSLQSLCGVGRFGTGLGGFFGLAFGGGGFAHGFLFGHRLLACGLWRRPSRRPAWHRGRGA
jgi:hypothetical protein